MPMGLFRCRANVERNSLATNLSCIQISMLPFSPHPNRPRKIQILDLLKGWIFGNQLIIKSHSLAWDSNKYHTSIPQHQRQQGQWDQVPVSQDLQVEPQLCLTQIWMNSSHWLGRGMSKYHTFNKRYSLSNTISMVHVTMITWIIQIIRMLFLLKGSEYSLGEHETSILSIIYGEFRPTVWTENGPIEIPWIRKNNIVHQIGYRKGSFQPYLF